MNYTQLHYEDADHTVIGGTFNDGVGIISGVTEAHESQWKAIHDSGLPIADYVEQIATWADVRADRDKRLAETDFHALSDVPMNDEMTAYRQALRDVPADNSDPDDISWPTKP